MPDPKSSPEQHTSLWLYVALWGIVAVILGVVLYIYAFEPMIYEASTVFKGEGTVEGLRRAEYELEHSGISTEENIILVILGWINFALPFAGLFAFVGIVYAGFLYVVNFANEEMAGKAKNMIFLSILGLIIIFSAYAIVSTIIRASTA